MVRKWSKVPISLSYTTPLPMCASCRCAAAMTLLAVAVAVSHVGLALFAMCLFLFAFSVSWASGFWVLVSELFSMRRKSAAVSGATAVRAPLLRVRRVALSHLGAAPDDALPPA